MLSSPIIDLAIGLIFVFGVTAAFASFVTELVARFTGLRAAYLLSGLRELVDGGGSSTKLVNMTADYDAMRELIQPHSKPAAQPAGARQPAEEPPLPSTAEQPSATGALLGGPILSNQGITGQFSSRETHARADHRHRSPAQDDAGSTGRTTVEPAQEPALLHFFDVVRRSRHRPART